jgi:transcriptional regulator with XRE-family HTH domain
MNNPLRAWRTDRQLTQVQLGKLIGVDGMTVSRWERGDHLPRKKHWAEIEKATGIAPSQLVGHVKQAEPEKAQ